MRSCGNLVVFAGTTGRMRVLPRIATLPINQNINWAGPDSYCGRIIV